MCIRDREQIVLETDCPYMAPEPVRGIRCDSSLIRYVGEYVASVKGISCLLYTSRCV